MSQTCNSKQYKQPVFTFSHCFVFKHDFETYLQSEANVDNQGMSNALKFLQQGQT
jgi:hypothetical protein